MRTGDDDGRTVTSGFTSLDADDVSLMPPPGDTEQGPRRWSAAELSPRARDASLIPVLRCRSHGPSWFVRCRAPVHSCGGGSNHKGTPSLLDAEARRMAQPLPRASETHRENHMSDRAAPRLSEFMKRRRTEL